MKYQTRNSCNALLLVGALALPAQAAQSPLLGVQAMSAGSFHTCAVVNGAAQCWGDNKLGELGTGTYLISSTPAPVYGLGHGVTGISTGSMHTCVLFNGGVRCWGRNIDGELGNGSTTPSNVPVAVTGISAGASAIGAGYLHTCAIVSGAAKCWGYNFYGQLGDGATSINETVPVAVSGIGSGATVISAGFNSSCAIVNGGAQCWGENGSGQLGNGGYADTATPIAVTGLASGVTAISAGSDLTCAIVNGAAKCWGSSGFGALGNGTTFTGSATPVDVTGLNAGVVAIAAGNGHACAAVNNDAVHPVKCWGYNNNGQLGNGSVNPSATPVDAVFFPPLASGETVTALVVGPGFFSCARIVNATTGRSRMNCWGANSYGQLGVAGPPVQNPTPGAVLGLASGVTSVGLGGAYSRHSCVTTSSGAKCWGYNDYGQLGDGITIDSSNPHAVSGLVSGVSGIAVGASHSCAVVNGGAQCWGLDNTGQLGVPNDSTTPMQVTGLSSGVAAIATGGDATCAVVNGGAKCWGDLVGGATPTAIAGLSSGVTQMAAGSSYFCAIVGGGMQCQGGNSSGQLGNGSISYSSSPTQVVGLTANVTAIAAGVSTTCAVVGGAAQCWGDNTYGQLGNGSASSYSTTPVVVTGLAAGVSAIASGGDNGEAHVCAVANGAAKCWGNNAHGQLGDGTFNSSSTPVAVTGLASGVVAISVGAGHSCALLGTGAEVCWGDGHYGQLGDGRLLTAETPQSVVQGDEIFADGFQ